MVGPEMDENGLIRMAGTVETIIYSNEENGYTICDLGVEEQDEIVTLVGIMPYLSEGDTVTVYGRWTHNPKYGRQFRVEQFEKQLPSDTASVLRYLSSHTVKGIGPKTAQKIVDAFGETAFDVIENHPEWLSSVGISSKKAQEISEDFKEKVGIRSAMMFFREYFGSAMTVRIYKRWGSDAVRRAKEDPYSLCEIEGIGFEKADTMAAKMGIPKNSESRVKNGLCYLLSSNAAQNGHVCLPREKLVAAGARLLGVPEETANAAVSALIGEGKLKYTLSEGISYLYTSYAYACEQYIAEKLVLLDKLCPRMNVTDIYGFIQREEQENGIEYDALQRKAIYHALESGVMVLSGGPGTGKTTVVRALLHIFRRMDCKVALAAPTGRAAKRLSESTSVEAKTIHRLLEMEYRKDQADGQTGFRRNEHDYLDEDTIILDEVSMIDNALMCALLKAIKPGARLVLIGDADQLPSVGAGNILRDIIDSGRFSTVLLTKIFRQAQESIIVTNAHAINEGRMPELGVKNKDFFFMPRSSDREIAETVAELCCARLPRAYGDLGTMGTQVITPSRRGEAGTENLNVLLQSRLNPPARGKREFSFREKLFREGDRVMQIRNNYDLTWTRGEEEGNGVFNGDIGTIEEIDVSRQMLRICFDDREVRYDFTLAEDLDHAWAITVHKSQGSEYPIVILPVYTAPPMLLTRNLFYTAVTRAEKMVILVGREDVVRSMVNNNRQSMRYTGLAKRLGGAE